LLAAFGACVDLFCRPFLEVNSLMAAQLALIVGPSLIDIPLGRRITRLERVRAEATPTKTTKSRGSICSGKKYPHLEKHAWSQES